MKLKNIIYEDFVNYKKTSMFILTTACSFKCEKEANCIGMCQNSDLVKSKTIEIDNKILIDRYLNNGITEAVVIGGLEPLDTFEDTLQFIKDFREKSNDDIVIYTGFNEDEIEDKIDILKKFKNIIVKFGRYRPNFQKHFDEVLGVELASPNQYAKRIS